jgi:hypothetical protein
MYNLTVYDLTTVTLYNDNRVQSSQVEAVKKAALLMDYPLMEEYDFRYHTYTILYYTIIYCSTAIISQLNVHHSGVVIRQVALHMLCGSHTTIVWCCIYTI